MPVSIVRYIAAISIKVQRPLLVIIRSLGAQSPIDIGKMLQTFIDRLVQGTLDARNIALLAKLMDQPGWQEGLLQELLDDEKVRVSELARRLGLPEFV